MGRSGSWARGSCSVLCAAAPVLALAASEVRPAERVTVTLNLLAYVLYQPGLDALIANFERVYPNVTVNAT